MNKDKTIEWCEANVATCREDIIDEMVRLQNKLGRHIEAMASDSLQNPMDYYGVTPELRSLIEKWRSESRMLNVIRNMEES